jgi:hypothetical protein
MFASGKSTKDSKSVCGVTVRRKRKNARAILNRPKLQGVS